MSDNEEKKNAFLNSVKSAAGKVAEKASNATDDVKEAAKKLKDEAVVKQAELKANIAEKKRQDDLAKLRPIFEGDLTQESLQYERLIRIVNYDKRLENDVCKGSIGFYEITPSRKIPTIYTKFVDKLDLTFYPHLSEAIFIADPCIAGKYIEIDEYFNYMKQVRVNELTVIAQALGAKEITVKLHNQKKQGFSSKLNAGVGAGIECISAGVSAGKQKSSKSNESFEIWASSKFRVNPFKGGPVMPSVIYFRNESDIQTLIQMAMSGKSKLTTRTYVMKASSSSGVSSSEVADIKASVKVIQCNAGASFEKSAENESNASLEYTIVF